jgi:hypothetical protein
MISLCKPLKTAGFATAILLVFWARIALAVDCSLPNNNFGISDGTTFNLSMSGFTSTDIQTAAGYWGCPGYSSYIPSFQVGGSGGIPVTVVRKAGNSTAPKGGCGLFDPEIVNGQIAGATITIWTNQGNGVSCEPLTDSLAHEFGHLLGLDDAPDPLGQCLGHIMGGRAAGFTREVQPDDCQEADQKWVTTYETTPPPDPYCDAYCQTYCVDNLCQDHPSPILMDLENDGIHLTGLDDPVWFDIDADGAPELMSWTDRGEGLLALDRNGNGVIDDGGELFGTATRLSDGTRAPNGYVALAELDSWVFGGNGDGHLDSSDAAFGSLLLWTDRNHDGISQPEELQTLAQAGIRRIDLDYKWSHRSDRYGNEFRFRGRAWKAGPLGLTHPILTWDVFFLVVP